jgi:hypothetical protein
MPLRQRQQLALPGGEITRPPRQRRCIERGGRREAGRYRRYDADRAAHDQGR